MTSRVAEMHDQRPTFLLGHVKLLCQTGDAEIFGRTPIDELFCQSDLIARHFRVADFAMLHQSFTTFARKILQP